MTKKVFRLVYTDFYSDEPEALANYYQEALGFRLTKEENGVYYLSTGYDHHNIVVTKGDKKGIKSYGYQLMPEYTVESAKEYLDSKGFPAEIVENPSPGIEKLVRVKDPAGNTLELFTEMEAPAEGFTGNGVAVFKLGHVAFLAKNIIATHDFYKDILGFYDTDKIGEHFANFMTINVDHHVINIVESDETRLHHIAFQLKDASHQYNASDILAKQGIQTLWGPSRHTAGSNIASYHHDTDGHVIELYTDMDVYLPELNMFEPRPWHEELPYKPKTWEGLTAWGTEFEFNLGTIKGVG